MQAQILSSPLSYRYLLNQSASKTLAFSRKHLNPFSAPKRNGRCFPAESIRFVEFIYLFIYVVYLFSCFSMATLLGFSPVGVFRRNLDGWKRKRGGTVYSSAEERNTTTNTLRKRLFLHFVCENWVWMHLYRYTLFTCAFGWACILQSELTQCV